MSLARFSRRVRGFTLIEVLCTLAILGVMMSVAFGTLHATLRGARRVSETLRAERTATGIARVLRRDLAYCTAYRERDLPALDGNASGEVRVALFTTRAISPGTERSISGLYFVEYLARRAEAGLTLLRRERPFIPGRDPREKEAVVEILSERCSRVAFGFYDGAAWRERWKVGHLPEAVRIELEVTRRGGNDAETFSAVAVPFVEPHADPMPHTAGASPTTGR